MTRHSCCSTTELPPPVRRDRIRTVDRQVRCSPAGIRRRCLHISFSNNVRRPTASRVAVTNKCGRSLTLFEGAVRDSNPVNHVLSHAFTATPSLARLDRTSYYETVDILTGCSPVSIPVQPV